VLELKEGERTIVSPIDHPEALSTESCVAPAETEEVSFV
jgi:hypothetical protein